MRKTRSITETITHEQVYYVCDRCGREVKKYLSFSYHTVEPYESHDHHFCTWNCFKEFAQMICITSECLIDLPEIDGLEGWEEFKGILEGGK